MKPLTEEQLAEDDSAIDAFQRYSKGVLDRWVLTQAGFFKAMADYINANAAKDECPICGLPESPCKEAHYPCKIVPDND